MEGEALPPQQSQKGILIKHRILGFMGDRHRSLPLAQLVAELANSRCKPQSTAPAARVSHPKDGQAKPSVSTAIPNTVPLDTLERECLTLWERALHDISLDKDKQEMLNEYKKAALSELIRCGLAAPGSSALDIAALRRAESWLQAKSAEQTAGSRGRELAVNTTRAFSSVTQTLSSSSSINPFVGLACAGLCVLTLVNPQ